MTLMIELSPEQESSLAIAAQQTGIQPVEMIQRLVTDYLPLLNRFAKPTQAMTPEQQIRAMDMIAEQSRNMSSVSDEAFDHENLFA